jgi:hypothetical protein
VAADDAPFLDSGRVFSHYRCASIGTDSFTARSLQVHIEALLSVALAE